MTDGIILIDKPAGMSSFGVVARIRRVLSERAGRRIKIGHTGTLDPFATGLMILVVGTECRNAGSYAKLDKTYTATIQLGATSTTGDPEGEITPVDERIPTLGEIEAACRQFTGEITQRPPQYSAIKINGRRAYDLARRGETVDMPLRTVHIYSLDILNYNYPLLEISCRVSSGTYIRSLATDIGESLGVGAYCQALRRISIDRWSIDEAQTLADFGIIETGGERFGTNTNTR